MSEFVEGTVCAHCKGPVRQREVLICALCGVTEGFVLETHGFRPCSAEGCVHGYDEDRRASCRTCKGKGYEVIS